MPIVYSTNGDEFEIKLLDRSYGGRTTTKFKVRSTDGALIGPNSNRIYVGPILSAVALGADNGSAKGYATVATAAVGDRLIAAFNGTDLIDVQAKFETTVSVAGQIQQSVGTDNYSAKYILFIFQRPE
jgi:hypothetical protein